MGVFHDKKLQDFIVQKKRTSRNAERVFLRYNASSERSGIRAHTINHNMWNLRATYH